MTQQHPQQAHVRDAADEDASATSGETLSYGLSEANLAQPEPAPTRAHDPSPPHPTATRAPGAAAAGVKFCKQCMKTQPNQGSFCVYCGSQDLTVIQTVQQESYLNQIVAKKFKIVEFIDRGGMGEVYLGLNEPLQQRVAIKFLHKKFASDESLVMRFLNEARSYCRVNHPNAVTLLEYGQHEDGALYIITEFIEGQSLSKTLKARGPLDADKVISIGKQICEVLSAAHRQGVIHRDLKPDNIMLIPGPRDRYQVKVLDFGIAKIKDDEHSNLTETGAIFGTPEFMSPEQAIGDGAEPRSDLYALGLILFYMITGKLAFSGKNKFAVLQSHIHDEPPRPSDRARQRDISPALESVILRCLRKRPEDRYEDADALYDALEEARQGAGIPSATMAPDPKPPSTRRPPALATSPDDDERDDERDDHDDASEDDASEDDLAARGALDDTGAPIDQELDLSHEDRASLGLADTISPHDAKPAVELRSLDLARERPDDDEDDDASLDEDLYLQSRRLPYARQAGVALLLLLLIGGGWIYLKISAPKPDSSPPVAAQAATPATDAQAPNEDLAQAQAQLNLTRDALDEGDLKLAHERFDRALLLARGLPLADEARQLKAQLELRLKTLDTLEGEARRAKEQRRCPELLATANAMQASSQGMAAQWRQHAISCQSQTASPEDVVPTKPNTKPDPRLKPLKPELTKPEAKPIDLSPIISKPEPKPEPKIESKIEPKPEIKPEIKPEPKIESKPDELGLPPKQL